MSAALLRGWLALAALLFAIGLRGLLSRRNAVAMLVSIELMVNAANLDFVAFGLWRGDATGRLVALFAIALTVVEAAVGLAIAIQLHRVRGGIDVDSASELEG